MVKLTPCTATISTTVIPSVTQDRARRYFGPKLFENVFVALTLCPLHLNQSTIKLTLEIRFQVVNRFPPFFGVIWLKTAIQYNVFQPLFLPLRTSVMVSFYKLWPITQNVSVLKINNKVFIDSVNILCVLTSSLHILCVYSVWTASVFSKPASLLQSYCWRISKLIPKDKTRYFNVQETI